MRIFARYLVLLLALFAISFALPRALPGDPLANLTGGGGQDSLLTLTPEARHQLEVYYGVDQPLLSQAGRFVGAMLHGDLGFSISYTRPVTQLILDRLPWTLLLVGLGLLLAGVLGCAAGLLAGYRQDRHRGLSAGLLLVGSLPDFVVGIGLILLLGVMLPILPLSGAASAFTDCGGPALAGCVLDIARHAAMPVLALALVQLPAFFLLMRAATLGELGQSYIVAARARGLSERRVATHHVGRNAILPVITLLGLRLGAMLGGVVVIETLFAYPGLGQLTYQAALARDFPVLQALFLLGGVAILGLNALADVWRRAIDPRLRVEPAR
ncbi:MAG TPA: ABC transporter permease [Candidatus Dormibacteraeota bacterium]|nr:ABC transporter permease [Candidatus Dormibacteraeota bacterium]